MLLSWHSLTKTPWVAVHTAFFVNLINVYRADSVSSSSHNSVTKSLPYMKNLHLQLANVYRLTLPRLHSSVWTSGRENSHPQQRGCCVPGSLTECGDSHVEKHGPCDNKPEAPLFAHMNAHKNINMETTYTAHMTQIRAHTYGGRDK